MAKLIVKWRYIAKGTPKHSQHLVKYIATRDGVEKCDESWKVQPATVEQKCLIDELLKDFPEAVDLPEYADYLETPNKYYASIFINLLDFYSSVILQHYFSHLTNTCRVFTIYAIKGRTA